MFILASAKPVYRAFTGAPCAARGRKKMRPSRGVRGQCASHVLCLHWPPLLAAGPQILKRGTPGPRGRPQSQDLGGLRAKAKNKAEEKDQEQRQSKTTQQNKNTRQKAKDQASDRHSTKLESNACRAGLRARGTQSTWMSTSANRKAIRGHGPAHQREAAAANVPGT